MLLLNVEVFLKLIIIWDVKFMVMFVIEVCFWEKW